MKEPLGDEKIWAESESMDLLLALRYQIYEIWGAWASQNGHLLHGFNKQQNHSSTKPAREEHSQSGPTVNPKQRIFLFKRIVHVISISYKYKMCPNLDPVKQVMQPIMMTNDQQSVDMAQKWGMKKGVP